MLELRAIRCAPHQKSHSVVIHEMDLLQIQHDALLGGFGCDESLQLGHLLPLNATTQGEDADR